MKVLLVNGSPHKNGCTNAALEVVAGELEKCGLSAEIFWCGNKPILGCLGCGKCKANHRCWHSEDTVNAFLEKAEGADGFVFGTPIHFSGTVRFHQTVYGQGVLQQVVNVCKQTSRNSCKLQARRCNCRV